MNLRVRRLLPLLALPLVLGLAAPQASAQEIALGLGKHGRKGAFSAQIVIGGARCAPAPLAPRPVWVPGHYANVERRIYVPGCERQEYVPAVYENRRYRDYCGRWRVERVLVREAHWRTVRDPGRYECVIERVWVPGSWKTYGC